MGVAFAEKIYRPCDNVVDFTVLDFCCELTEMAKENQK